MALEAAAAVAEVVGVAKVLMAQALAPTAEAGEAVATPVYSNDGRAAVAAVAAAAGGRQKTCGWAQRMQRVLGEKGCKDAEDWSGGREAGGQTGGRAGGRAGGRVPRLAQEAALRVSP